MSAPIFTTDILFTQRLLACAGLYHGNLDGRWGPLTHQAQDAFDEVYARTMVDLGSLDPRSEAVIMTLLPKAQIAARMWMKAAKSLPFVVKLLSGTRSYAEQDHLYEQRPKVTNAKGGWSNHNFGIAWDAGIFADGDYYEGRTPEENRAYANLAKVTMAAVGGIEAGIDWTSFKDAPHYQLKTGKSVSQVRALFEAGRQYV